MTKIINVCSTFLLYWFVITDLHLQLNWWSSGLLWMVIRDIQLVVYERIDQGLL